ncbi:MAG: hypothetical protein ACJAZV_002060, partial [Roseivirga sp.]
MIWYNKYFHINNLKAKVIKRSMNLSAIKLS